jgi:hypothetical protein
MRLPPLREWGADLAPTARKCADPGTWVESLTCP